MNSITRLNYEKVLLQINNLEKNISKLNSEINRLRSSQQDLNSCWQGEASDSFKTKINTLIMEMERTKADMMRLVEKIRTVANRIKAEDQKQADLAANL